MIYSDVGGSVKYFNLQKPDADFVYQLLNTKGVKFTYQSSHKLSSELGRGKLDEQSRGGVWAR